jgi:hypothetical protein
MAGLKNKEGAMKTTDMDFENRKQEVLNAAREQGIVDVVSASNSVSLETVELATKLMKKHGSNLQQALEKRRKSQG